MTEEQAYKDGDLVRLKSGGPVMTVELTRNDGILPCVWFAGEILQRDSFHPDMIMPCDSDQLQHPKEQT